MTTLTAQPNKFKSAAYELDCDDDDQCFEGRLKKLVKVKPKSENSE